MYGILNYIIKPDKYCAVKPPAQAPEEFVDNDEHCVLSFSAALLDAASLPNLTQSNMVAPINDLPYDYDNDEHVHKDFPDRKRALDIL